MLVKTIIRLQIGAQSATMGPPLGPTLGQFGVSAVDFIKKFNDQSVVYIKGTILTTIVRVYANRTYDINILGPTLSFLVKRVYSCDRFMGSLKNFNNFQLFINEYIMCELYFLIKNYISIDRMAYNTNNFRIKCVKGQSLSWGLLYYCTKRPQTNYCGLKNNSNL